MYLTTVGVSPCLESVISISAAHFLHIALWGGHQLVMALNSRLRSSFRASSSAGDVCLHK